MTWLIEQNESVASRRVVEFRTFKSDGTSPDTGSSNSSLRMSIGGNAQFTPNALVSAISANAGMYYFVLNQSDVSALGNHPLWYEGAFPQHVATAQVVGFNPFSRTSAFTSADSVGLKAVTHSQATVGGLANYSNLSGNISNLTVRVQPMAYSGLTVEVNNASGDVSSRWTVGVASTSTIAGVTNAVLIRSGTYSAVSLRLDANAVPAGAFQADSIDAVGFAAMNLSDVTVRVQPMAYSGLTVGISDAVGDFSSKFTVGVGKMAAGTYSGVTISGVQSMVSADVHRIVTDNLAALRLLSHTSSVVTGQAVTGQLSTTTMTADVAEATNDHFNDAVLVFTSGALAYQRTSVTSYFGLSATSSRFVFPALTEAPANGDTFIIV